jgi:hypothetical protein
LKINDSSSFINCVSSYSGGGIYAVISGGEVELNGITMNGCSSLNGGGVYSSISGSGKLTITNLC